jgi:hypothetical protein
MLYDALRLFGVIAALFERVNLARGLEPRTGMWRAVPARSCDCGQDSCKRLACHQTITCETSQWVVSRCVV